MGQVVHHIGSVFERSDFIALDARGGVTLHRFIVDDDASLARVYEQLGNRVDRNGGNARDRVH